MYEYYMPSIKHQNKRTARKISAGKGANIKGKQIQKPMSAFSHYFVPSAPIQMVTFLKYPYAQCDSVLFHGQHGRKYEWKDAETNRINGAIAAAVQKLKDVRKKLFLNGGDGGGDRHFAIECAITGVIDVLAEEKEPLYIYPLFKRSCFGEAAEGKHEISLTVSRQMSDFELQKTLIHEAFHIIGGCQEYKDETGEWVETPDDPCDDNLKGSDALGFIRVHNNIRDMSADHFAQFIMKY